MIDRDGDGEHKERPMTMPGLGRQELPLIAESTAMRQVLDEAHRIAQTDLPVLLLGETGVGKERVARFIHEQSPWREGPFVAVNCGGIPETLFMSAMFGQVRGAFTGADADALGFLRMAAGGTLLLDEVGNLPPAAQVSLLRALDGQKVYPVGPSSRPYYLEARVLAATDHPLKAKDETRAFSPALYFRLAGSVIEIPPLRERRDDIVPLARAFLGVVRKRGGADGEHIGHEAAEALQVYPWPGNVRELRHVVMRSLANGGPPGLAVIRRILAQRGGSVGPWSSEALRVALGREPMPVEVAVHETLEHGGRMSIAAVARTLGRDKDAVRRALRPLLEAGVAVQGGRGRGAWIELAF